MQLFELLRDAAPALVDPGTTAQWEMHLDAVVTSKMDFRAVIDGIAAEAGKMISVLRQRPRGGVDLQAEPVATPATGKQGKQKNQGTVKGGATAKTPSRAASSKQQKSKTGKTSSVSTETDATKSGQMPTPRMISYAQKLAKIKGVPLPPNCEQDFQVCRHFLDEHS